LGFAAVSCETISLRAATMLWESSVATIEIPTDEPMLRTRLKSDAASARNRGSSVAKASVESGTKTSPSPSPCTTPETTSGRQSICGENAVICHSE
jgi:hypothetical protein